MLSFDFDPHPDSTILALAIVLIGPPVAVLVLLSFYRFNAWVRELATAKLRRRLRMYANEQAERANLRRRVDETDQELLQRVVDVGALHGEGLQ